MLSCMIALTATMSVPVKCSEQCLARCDHSVDGRWVVIVIATVIMLIIFPKQRETSQNLKIIQTLNEPLLNLK